MIHCCNQHYAKDLVHRTNLVLNSEYSFKGTWWSLLLNVWQLNYTMHDYVYPASFPVGQSQTNRHRITNHHQIRPQHRTLTAFMRFTLEVVKTSSVIEYVLTRSLSALGFFFFFLRISCKSISENCGRQISNKRCVTLRFECPTLRFFPKTLNSDCLEVIKNPNTHTKEKKLINSTNVINVSPILSLLEVLNS